MYPFNLIFLSFLTIIIIYQTSLKVKFFLFFNYSYNCFTQININKHDFYVKTDYDGKLVNPDHQELPLFEDHDKFDLSIKDNLIDKHVNTKLSKLLHENSNLTRLEKLELALLEQHE